MVTAVMTVECSVVDSPPQYTVPPIIHGSRPNIRFGQRYAICGVAPIGVDAIGPGQTGQVRVTAMFDDADRDAIKAGAKFEFRSGPTVPWAHCRILVVHEVR